MPVGFRYELRAVKVSSSEARDARELLKVLEHGYRSRSGGCTLNCDQVQIARSLLRCLAFGFANADSSVEADGVSPSAES